ncbi:class I SAM-dependent methyltransferase [Azospirillum picis]|uniref:SAM-dependent methyltransferase n=1 Tax=Azospirillum picis TaxID=488438 RepID=A0ABU0MGX7_9PROT|nr:class I SAM-dependent methyltransferase [Azospirillum picis]MBP2299104.1 SAM-dependent methyltransferase [Azospirillum picis]MDQ0532654.1 SAM-dependent methyltransferase [Azospirillum picis]
MHDTADLLPSDRLPDIQMSDEDVLARYRRKFHLSPACQLDMSMVRHHWDLERRLARELLGTPPEERWTAFEQAYTTLYQSCPWLNEAEDDARTRDDDLDFRHFLSILGGPQDVYEVGSGKARLLRYLARHGYRCVATEVTRERGAGWIEKDANIEWRCCDGVNLARFEPEGRYDSVISTHVVEHLHPDDVPAHMRNVAAILKPGGKYVLCMPHKYAGPCDLSDVFGLTDPVCMHLREYGWDETAAMLRAAGFGRIEAVYILPYRLRRHLKLHFASRAYFGYMRLVESVLGALPLTLNRKLGRIGQLFLFRPEVFIVAHKAPEPT